MSQRLKLEVKALNAIAGEDLVILVSDRLVPPGQEDGLAGQDEGGDVGLDAVPVRGAAGDGEAVRPAVRVGVDDGDG